MENTHTRTYVIKLVIKTQEGNPKKWDWSELVGEEVEVVDCELLGE